MNPPILIAGQGLAGTVLAWQCEQLGREFLLVDPGHERAASRVGAGIINPVTGMRVVKSEGLDECLPLALETYRAMESAWGKGLLREVQVKRFFVSDAEKGALLAKLSRGSLSPYVTTSSVTDDSFAISPAWRLDIPRLIRVARRYWEDKGYLQIGKVDAALAQNWDGPVVWCHGAANTSPVFTRAAGAELVIGGDGWLPDQILNRGGRWLLPITEAEAWVGATYDRDREVVDAELARENLERSAREILGRRSFVSGNLLTGIRMTTADRLPVADWFPGKPGWQMCINGLGSKGALRAPWCANRILELLAERESDFE